MLYLFLNSIYTLIKIDDQDFIYINKIHIILFLLTLLTHYPSISQTIVKDSIDSLNDSIPGMSAVELDAVTVTAEMKKRDAVTETITVTNAMRKGTNNAIDMLGNNKSTTRKNSLDLEKEK